MMTSSTRHRYKWIPWTPGSQDSRVDLISRYNIDTTRPDSRNILILSAGFGSGHLSVAHALRESFYSLDPRLNIVILDLLDILSPSLSPSLYATYQLMVNKAGGIYNYFYNRKKHGKDIMTSRAFRAIFIPQLLALVEKMDPQMIISTFPLCTYYASYLKTLFLPHLNLVTCITDVVCNQEWIHPGVDLYLVANAEIKRYLLELGVHRSKVCASGIPVRQEFMKPSASLANLESYRLEPDTPLILLMGGGGGNLPEDMSFYRWLDELPAITSLVLCGKNARLLKKLGKIEKHGGLRCHGFSHDVPDLMRRADLLVTRAGGVTVFEAIASTLPILIYNPQMGQELQNTSYVVERGLGKGAKTPRDLRRLISDYLQDTSGMNKLVSNLQCERESMEWEQIPLRLLSLLNESANCESKRRSG